MRQLAAVLGVAFFSMACRTPGPCVRPARKSCAKPAPAPKRLSKEVPSTKLSLKKLSPGQYPVFKDDFADKEGLIRAAKKTLDYLKKKDPDRTFRVGGREYRFETLSRTARELIHVVKLTETGEDLDELIRERFDVFKSVGSDGKGRVVFSSYYQPVLKASLKKTGKYRFPIYKRPDDMVEANLGVFDKKLRGKNIVGRIGDEGKLIPYLSRRQIDMEGAFTGKGWEIAWFKDKFDVFDLHIQGSGLIQLPDGRERLAKFAATNALKYKSVALTLVRRGIYKKKDLNHDKVRRYFNTHPEEQDEFLAYNPRYTFFEIVELPEGGEPFGTIQETLSPYRSIAIDPKVIPLGAVAYFTTTSPRAKKNGEYLGKWENSRLAMAMDTGGAIKGPARVDIYVGHGPQATTVARNQWAPGELFFLLIKDVPR